MSSTRPLPESTLRAVLDHLIPADSDPGALEVGTDRFVLTALQTGDVVDPTLIAGGLGGLDQVARSRWDAPFAALKSSDQDALLGDVERGVELPDWPGDTDPVAFFDALLALAHEGFYAGPDSGGTVEPWSMLGYRSRVPGRP